MQFASAIVVTANDSFANFNVQFQYRYSNWAANGVYSFPSARSQLHAMPPIYLFTWIFFRSVFCCCSSVLRTTNSRKKCELNGRREKNYRVWRKHKFVDLIFQFSACIFSSEMCSFRLCDHKFVAMWRIVVLHRQCRENERKVHGKK